MKKSTNPILKEISWLAGVLVLTVLVCLLLFSWDLRHGTIDVHVHDTYFVFTAATFIVPLFLAFSFLLYFFKELPKKYMRLGPNLVLFVTGLLLITLLALANNDFVKLVVSKSNWTIYPPLSPLPQPEAKNTELYRLVAGVTTAFTVLQITVTVALVYAAFQWGRNRKATKDS